MSTSSETTPLAEPSPDETISGADKLVLWLFVLGFSAFALMLVADLVSCFFG